MRIENDLLVSSYYLHILSSLQNDKAAPFELTGDDFALIQSLYVHFSLFYILKVKLQGHTETISVY